MSGIFLGTTRKAGAILAPNCVEVRSFRITKRLSFRFAGSKNDSQQALPVVVAQRAFRVNHVTYSLF